MKISTFVTVAYLVSVTASFAGVGDTREQCDGLYGQPSASYEKAQLERPSMFPGGAPLKMEWKASLVCVYAPTPTCQVVAWFIPAGEKMICNAIYCRSYNQAENLQAKYLTVPAPAIKWSEDPGNRQSSWELLSKGFTRSDGKVVASYNERAIDGLKLRELIIFSPAP